MHNYHFLDIFLANICRVQDSFPIMYGLSYLDIKNGIKRGKGSNTQAGKGLNQNIKLSTNQEKSDFCKVYKERVTGFLKQLL